MTPPPILLRRSWSPPLMIAVFVVQVFSSFNSCLSHNNDTQYLKAVATWYGPPTGAGSTGGACGYCDSVEKPPLHKLIAAGGDAFFKGGKGCGACYKVKCKSHPDCSTKPIHIVITDQCPGTNEHFDLSGHAFGAMAIPGKEESLRNAGKLEIRYRRFPCNFKNTPVKFHVDAGSNPYYLAVMFEFLEGDGTLCLVELKAANSNEWVQMQPSWGALWKHDCSSPLEGPVCFRVTSGETKQVTVFNDILPKDWKAGADYFAASRPEL
ncbi:Putative expansin-B2 [Linum grandiflorum]